ncbi:MAG: long-chain fatty acid--CoA ligase [Spirochaetes bacterium]|nr:long-chain fatty acid--CoA ligase [Spirochaetota bacterium]
MKNMPWHKSYVPGVPASIDYERITMPEALRSSARRHPDNAALIMMGNAISFAQLDGYVDRFAAALAELGVGKGDTVALILPNIPQMVIATYALFRLGAVAVMNNPLYTERELEHNLADSGAKTAICLDFFVPRVLALREKTGVAAVITCHMRDFIPSAETKMQKDHYNLHMEIAPQEGLFEFMDLLKGAPAAPPAVQVGFDDLAALMYTGGTTGVSKAVMLSHGNSSISVQQFRAWLFDLEEGKERVLAVLPFFHVAGYTDIMNQCIYRGFTAILVPRPDAAIIHTMIREYRPTVFGAVPTLYVGLMNHPEFRNTDFSFIKGCLSGAAPMAMETLRAWEAVVGTPIIELYGLTETTAICHFNPWRGTAKVGSVGVPVPDTECRIVDLETGQTDLPFSQPGEVIVRGPQVCGGYYGKPEETMQSLRDGWLYTGDIGYMDDQGYLFIVDRKKDLIIAGGYNIYPREIDEVLYEHPKVKDACSFGIPDSYRGETVKAVVVLKPDESATEKEMEDFCRERLSAYKVPKQFEFREQLPLSATGKILRRVLRDEAMAEMNAAGK